MMRWMSRLCVVCLAMALSPRLANGDASQQDKAKTHLFVQLPAYCPTPDGMAIDSNGSLVVACPNYGDPSQPACLIKIDDQGNIYVADFSNNAVAKVSPDGTMTVLAQNGDTDGQDGALDQPGEPIVWGETLIVTCFDKVTGPDKVNTQHDKPFTIVALDIPDQGQ